MAYTRRSSHRRSLPLSDSPAVSRKKYLLRRSIARTPSRIPTRSSTAHQGHRPVLVPLHPNLRPLPSRRFVRKVAGRGMNTRNLDQVTHVGAKRKRDIDENALTNDRGVSRRKRLRTSDETDRDLDTLVSCSSSTAEEEMSGTEIEENEEEGASESSSDGHLLHFSKPERLGRLKKPDLMRLYAVAGLADDAELFTKHEIIDSLILARQDNASLASLPLLSPVDRSDNSSLGSLTDDGNMAGGEETDTATNHYQGTLRRRVTFQDFGTGIRHIPKGRSISLGNLMERNTISVNHTRTMNYVGESSRSFRTRTSAQSPPTSSTPVSATTRRSPPATRLRSRKMSSAASIANALCSPANSSKTKTKEVDFTEQVVKSKAHIKRRQNKREAEDRVSDQGSNLADVDEVEEYLNGVTDGSRSRPSPRRLRSKETVCDQGKDKSFVINVGAGLQRITARSQKRVSCSRTAQKRVTRTRLKRGVCELSGQVQRKEEDSLEEEANELGGEGSEEGEGEEDGEEVGEQDEDAKKNRDRVRNDAEEVDDDEEEEGEINRSILQLEDEADEFVSFASTTPLMPPSRRTPLRKRLRPRTGKGSLPPDGGDVQDGGEEDEGGTTCSEEREVVNEIWFSMDVDSETGEEREVTDSRLNADADGETDKDEVMKKKVDLTVANAKILVRLRRDDLVRLCETRNLKPMGTKHQLAEALLQWQDRQANEPSSPSSTRRHRCKATISSIKTSKPVLLRSERTHQDEPRTPVPDRDKEADPDLELDLESLGLEDREIPPEKLIKLEKIGSGGFKDVFIGKFKGRRVAISEFRGTLSVMDIKELKLLGGFDHPNIVRFLGVSIPENTKETPVMIVSELCSNGDLFDYIRNTNSPSLHKVLSMMLDIARGLEYLHACNPSVIHRDCKSSNILITARGTAKIADFGLAKVKQSTRSMVKSLVGTVNWQAPELWTAHPKYNHKVDVFSCALVFWEMLQWHLPTRKHPWEGMNEHAIYDLVGAKRQRPSVSGLREQWCPEIVDLIEHMWAQEHQDRPTMSEVVQKLEKVVAHN